MVVGALGLVVLLGLGLVTVVSDQAAPVPVAAGGLAAMPDSFRALYVAAAATCPGLAPELLMAIGEVESGHGANDGPSSAGAVGPMQFEPATFASVAYPVPPGGMDPPSPWDPTDAIYGAARLLCSDGAGNPATLAAAIFAYNHDDAYVAHVLAVAAQYAGADSPAPSPAPRVAP